MSLLNKAEGPHRHLPRNGTKKCDKILQYREGFGQGALHFHHRLQEHLLHVATQRCRHHVAVARGVARPSRASPSPAPTGGCQVAITRLVLCALAVASPSRPLNSMYTATGRIASNTTTRLMAVFAAHVATALKGNTWRTKAPGSTTSAASAAETARSCSGMAISMSMARHTARRMHGGDCSPGHTNGVHR